MKICFFAVLWMILPFAAVGRGLPTANIQQNQKAEKPLLDSLIAGSYFKMGNVEGARRALKNAREAKTLARAQGYRQEYAKALELEGVALFQLGERQAGIDSIEKAVLLYHQEPNRLLLAEGNYSLGNAYEQTEAYGAALESFKVAKAIFTEEQDTVRLGSVINNIANIYFHTGNYDEALDYYFQAIHLKQQTGKKAGLARSYSNIALIYKNIGQYDKALAYSHKAISIQREVGDDFSLSISLLNTGKIYRWLQQYDSALLFHREALKLSRQLQDSIGIGLAYYSMGQVAYSQQNLPQAIEYFQDAMAIFQPLQLKSYLVQAYVTIAITYLEMGETAKATTAALAGLNLLEGVDVKTTHQSLAETLYNIYKQKGDYQQALKYHELFTAYTDSLLNAEKVKELARLETNFQIKQKDNEIALLSKTRELDQLQIKQAKNTRLLLIALLTFILLVAGAIYSRYRLKVQAEKILAAKNQELNELNATKDKFFAIIAHDLRNPLSAFKSLSTALRENFTRLSETELQQYLENLKNSSAQLIELLQNLLQWALVQTQNLRHKASNIDLNKVLQKNIALLQQNAREKDIQIIAELDDNALAYADEVTVDLVFRNLLSNAIKFTNPGGKVKVVTRQTAKGIEVSVEDTGIGMSANDMEKLFDITRDPATIGQSTEKGTGLGLILCKEFVTKNNGFIKVESQPGEGSKFVVILPDKNLKTAA